MIFECICAKCGKNFVPAAEHAYKDDHGLYCSWTCFNHRNVGKPKRTCKQVLQYDEDMRLVRVYPSAASAAEHIESSTKHIYLAIETRKKHKNYFWRYDHEMSQV